MRKAISGVAGRAGLAVVGAGLVVSALAAGVGDGPVAEGATANMVWPAICRAAPLDVATDFNLFIFGNVTQRGSDTEGRLAAGGTVTLSDYSIGEALPPAPAVPDVLVVGGGLMFERGSMVRGNAVSVLPGRVTDVSFAPGAGYRRGTVMDFDNARSTLRLMSAFYAGLATNGTTDMAYGQITLTGADQVLNVFNLTDVDLAAAGSVTVAVPDGSTVLVNVFGTAVELRALGLALRGVSPSRVLYNFPNATTLALESIGVEGSILAPYAAVLFTNGVIRGTLVGASLTGSGQANHVPFTGCLP